MNNATMLYRAPGPECFEGVACETTIVDESDVDAHLADGWHRNWIEAGEVVKEAQAKLEANEKQQAEIEAQIATASQTDDAPKGKGRKAAGG